MRTFKLILEALFWALAAGVVIAGAGTVIGLITLPAIGYISAVAIIAVLPLLLRAAKVIRKRRAAMTLAYLEQAVRLNLPLNKMLYAAARSETGRLARSLGSLHALLEQGYPVGASLHSSVPEITERHASIVESSERIGRLPQALRRLVNELSSDARTDAITPAGFYRAYPLVLIVVMGTVVSMVMIFVIPKYEAIFRDFGTKLPPVTQALLEMARVFANMPILLFLFPLLVLLACGVTLWQTFRPARLSETGLGVARDTLAWYTPVLHGIERDRGLADVFDLMAEALSAGLPMDRALTEATRLNINHRLRLKLTDWGTGMLSGAALAESARQSGLPALVVGLLSSAHNTNALADTFAFLARYYRSRFSKSAAVIQGMSIPALVLVFGALVAFVVAGLFVPMITLIDNMLPMKGGM